MFVWTTVWHVPCIKKIRFQCHVTPHNNHASSEKNKSSTRWIALFSLELHSRTWNLYDAKHLHISESHNSSFLTTEYSSVVCGSRATSPLNEARQIVSLVHPTGLGNLIIREALVPSTRFPKCFNAVETARPSSSKMIVSCSGLAMNRWRFSDTSSLKQAMHFLLEA